jgi:hypothetical protein
MARIRTILEGVTLFVLLYIMYNMLTQIPTMRHQIRSTNSKTKRCGDYVNVRDLPLCVILPYALNFFTDTGLLPFRMTGYVLSYRTLIWK